MTSLIGQYPFSPEQDAVLKGANARRAAQAASRDAQTARDIIADTARYGALPRLWQDVVRARADNPDATLTQLGAILGMTKDQYTGLWRRAKQKAGQV